MLIINRLYALALLLAALAWFWSADTVGVVFGVGISVCAYFVYKQTRIGYFAAAVLCAGMLKLSIDRYSEVYSEAVKHTVSLLAFVGIILAIVLHEKFAKKSAGELSAASSTESSTGSTEPSADRTDTSKDV